VSSDVESASALLEIRGVSKVFGATRALASIDLDVRAGEVHAVLGENGAGKSTLMKVLGGVVAPDEGALRLDGAPFTPRDPGQARRAGVAVVHQERALCPHLTVAENVFLGDEPTRGIWLDAHAMQTRSAALLIQLAGEARASRIDVRAKVATLAPGDQQLVEIARALAAPAPRVIVFDEPTSTLDAADVAHLFAAIRALRDRGLAVLYVSHFLEEVRAIADRYTVLRDGAKVAEGPVEGSTIDGWVSAMAGRAIEALYPRTARAADGEIVLEARALAGVRLPRDASFTLRRGEVLGIAGLVGAGRTELLRAIFGLDPIASGALRVLHVEGAALPSARLRAGVGMLSEDRAHEGVALARSIADNVGLSRLPWIVREAAQRAIGQTWIDRLGIRAPSVGAPVSALSGGNQQKVALARLLHHDVDVLLLDEPTRGIDVASKATIYGVVDELASRGKAVLLVSSQIPELLGVCDRVAVMARGVLGPARPVSEWTEEAILAEATATATTAAA
jgi:ribose transport system ATP-binding protein